MTRPPSPSRLGELDALRGIAALIVVAFHYTYKAPEILPSVQTIAWHASWGHFGVQLFFAISGFVIFMTLERTRSAADFAVSRFARLFPAYWTGVVLSTLGVTLLGAGQLALDPVHTAINLTMLQGFFYLPSVDGVYWSLTVELAFYVCMLALWRARLLDRIEWVLLGWIGLHLLWLLVPALPSRIGLVLALDYIVWFAVGMAAYRVRIGARTWAQQAPVLLAGLAVTAYAGKPGEVAVFLGVAALFAALSKWQLGLLNRPVLLWLGGISYPLYLVHQNLGYALMARLEALGVSPWLALIAALAAALALADAIHRWIEGPALDRIRSAWKSRQVLRPA